ncbi:thymidine kinase [Arsenophonus sp. PmNCSU2021_1]|uniref:thymidine kinase n=1 Tax=Arsenophonus sp. PmNCSU2021_1 TaxID=3118989 RepID=UPI002FF30949
MAQFYFYYSAMNAGKSTSLLQSSYNYNERGMNTLIFTAEIDTRFVQGKVTSRIGLAADAILFSQQTDMGRLIKEKNSCQKIHWVLVDECHFLTKEQVSQLCEIVDYANIPVLCYGLRTDFRGELFIGSNYLLAWADKLIELKTICYCGRKASRVLRLDDNGLAVYQGEQIEIGGNEKYISVCRRHYMDAINHTKCIEAGEKPFSVVPFK